MDQARLQERLQKVEHDERDYVVKWANNARLMHSQGVYDFILEVAGISSDARVLELGTGTGEMALAIMSEGRRTFYGIDFNPYSLEATAHLLSHHTIPTNVTKKNQVMVSSTCDAYERRPIIDEGFFGVTGEANLILDNILNPLQTNHYIKDGSVDALFFPNFGYSDSVLQSAIAQERETSGQDPDPIMLLARIRIHAVQKVSDIARRVLKPDGIIITAERRSVAEMEQIAGSREQLLQHLNIFDGFEYADFQYKPDVVVSHPMGLQIMAMGRPVEQSDVYVTTYRRAA